MLQTNRRSFALSLSAFAMTGCGSVQTPTRQSRTIPAQTMPPSSAPSATSIYPPNFGDADPVDFSFRKPAHYPVHGIDAARFQKSSDWKIARANGVNFAWIKATEGGDLRDPMFHQHWRGARHAGIPTGAYHFYYFCTDAEVQARWFIQNVHKHKGMLPPVLDMEWNPFSPTCSKRPPAKVVRREARIFIAAIQAHYGQYPLVYTTPGFFKDNELHRLGTVEFWLRATAEHPTEAYANQKWRFWQYSGTGIVPGFEGATDLNLFNGSAADWRGWLAARRV